MVNQLRRRILVLSFYFSPDLCAGSFRATPVVEALSKMAGPTVEIDVVTTQPNRYVGFAPNAPAKERRGNVKIIRIRLPQHRSGVFDQAFAFSVFAVSVLRHTMFRRYDLVIATSSRLFTASLGALIARLKGARLYLDIRDIFVDTVGDVYKGAAIRWLLPIIRFVERWTLRYATKINLVSGGFREYFEQRVANARLGFITNGVDEEFLAPFPAVTETSELPVILYAGNIGEGQGLHRIIPKAAEMAQNYEFVVIGDGGAKHLLEAEVRRRGVKNVRVLQPMDRAALREWYARAEILFVHLNDHPAFRKVLPSKIFEYAATGKPMIAGLSGFSASFVADNILNAAVFPPCDASGLIASVSRVRPGLTDRSAFVSRYTRKAVAGALAEDILNVAFVQADPEVTSQPRGQA